MALAVGCAVGFTVSWAVMFAKGMRYTPRVGVVVVGEGGGKSEKERRSRAESQVIHLLISRPKDSIGKTENSYPYA